MQSFLPNPRQCQKLAGSIEIPLRHFLAGTGGAERDGTQWIGMEPDGAGWSFWDWACVESLFFVESRRAKRKNGIFGLLAGRRVQIFLARAGRSQSLVNQKTNPREIEHSLLIYEKVICMR